MRKEDFLAQAAYTEYRTVETYNGTRYTGVLVEAAASEAFIFVEPSGAHTWSDVPRLRWTDIKAVY